MASTKDPADARPSRIERPGRAVTLSRSLAVSKIRPAYEQVAEQLRELILNGTLVPGDRLPAEAELSSIFGVSRSTTREAIRLLSSQNLLYAVRGAGGGTFVSSSDPAQVSEFLETSIGLLSGNDEITSAELLEARALLEVPAAGLAALRRSDEDLEALRAAIKDEQQTTDRGARFEHHRIFHTVVLDAAGNRLVTVLTSPLFRVIRTRFLGDTTGRPFWRQVDSDHQEILERIDARDAAGASASMQRHLERLSETYARVERSRSERRG